MKLFTSDLQLHHEHQRIVEFTNRGKDTTQENHTEWLINLWNSQAKKGDVVYVLGDYSFAKKYDDIAKFTESLNGQKIFIKGNHDRRENLDRLVKDNLIEAWYDYKEIKLQDIPTVLFHFPVSAWHRQGYGALHLHGHCHGNHADNKGKMLDVGLDSAYNIFGKHKFFTEQDVIDLLKEKQIYISDHHKERS